MGREKIKIEELDEARRAIIRKVRSGLITGREAIVLLKRIWRDFRDE